MSSLHFFPSTQALWLGAQMLEHGMEVMQILHSAELLRL